MSLREGNAEVIGGRSSVVSCPYSRATPVVIGARALVVFRFSLREGNAGSK